MAPLVASRTMRSGPTASIADLARRPGGDPAPVLARLAATPFDTRGTAAEASLGTMSADHAGGASIPGITVRREERPVVARAALGSGRSPSSSLTSTVPLARAVAGMGGPDAIPTGMSSGALSWSPGSGFTTVAQAPGPFVQRAVEIDEVTVTPGVPAAGGAESGAAASGQAGPAGASAAAAGGAGTDYEELAEHVYDRIRSRLTSELLLDRERSGTLVDG
jgi:hypothetical protein